MGNGSSGWSNILAWSAGFSGNLGRRDAWVIVSQNSATDLVLQLSPGGTMVIPWRSELPEWSKGNSDNVPMYLDHLCSLLRVEGVGRTNRDSKC